jgi:hypothetical protein
MRANYSTDLCKRQERFCGCGVSWFVLAQKAKVWSGAPFGLKRLKGDLVEGLRNDVREIVFVGLALGGGHSCAESIDAIGEDDKAG